VQQPQEILEPAIGQDHRPAHQQKLTLPRRCSMTGFLNPSETAQRRLLLLLRCPDHQDAAEEVEMSLERLRSIWRMPSATRNAGLLPNLPQKDMWSLTASSRTSPPPFFFFFLRALTTSSLTASEHSPHSHRPPNSAFTPAMYSTVQSSRSPQHSHMADSISMPLPDGISILLGLVAYIRPCLIVDPAARSSFWERNDSRSNS
jgi:hypothetical protein